MMDHQAFAQLLGNYGEFVGAIAVVLTLFYLTTQIRQSSRSLKSSAAQAVLQSISEQYRVAAESEKLARVVRLGFEDFEELDADQANQFLFGFSLGSDSWSKHITTLKMATFRKAHGKDNLRT